MIELLDLKKNYNSVEAVRGVTLNVEAGETFALLGPNGAGKTTVINILCTLLRASSGVAKVNSFDCTVNPEGVRKSIGLVFQEVTLDNELTAYENLKFHCYLYNMDSALTEARITEMLGVVGLLDKAKDLVKTFSGGMKRRLEIVRGLLHRPKVLFLDEPTLGLDPQTRSRVWEFIAELKAKEGSTVFMTTHYMDEAEVCDRIAVIDNGKIIACDSPAALKSSLKGDTVYLRTGEDAKARIELKEKFLLEVKDTENGLAFIVEKGAEFIPVLFKELSVPVLSVSVKRPTLDDVFLHLTGKEIRDSKQVEKNNRRGRS